MKKTCNQCRKQMKKHTAKAENGPEINFWVCHYPDCPNYALIQISMEDMKKYEKE